MTVAASPRFAGAADKTVAMGSAGAWANMLVKTASTDSASVLRTIGIMRFISLTSSFICLWLPGRLDCRPALHAPKGRLQSIVTRLSDRDLFLPARIGRAWAGDRDLPPSCGRARAPSIIR